MMVSNLDGSELEFHSLNSRLTCLRWKEMSYSHANGALGVSRDEGWDTSDTWYFNTTTSTATYASVRISSLTNGLGLRLLVMKMVRFPN